MHILAILCRSDGRKRGLRLNPTMVVPLDIPGSSIFRDPYNYNAINQTAGVSRIHRSCLYERMRDDVSKSGIRFSVAIIESIYNSNLTSTAEERPTKSRNPFKALQRSPIAYICFLRRSKEYREYRQVDGLRISHSLRLGILSLTSFLNVRRSPNSIASSTRHPTLPPSAITRCG